MRRRGVVGRACDPGVCYCRNKFPPVGLGDEQNALRRFGQRIDPNGSAREDVFDEAGSRLSRIIGCSCGFGCW